MRSALALTLATTLLGGGCFPHSAKKRAIAEIIEGALVAGGVALEATVKTTADCQAELNATASCGADGTRNGGIGVAMILTGVIAFIATISSASEETTPAPIQNAPAAKPAPKPAFVPTVAPAFAAAPSLTTGSNAASYILSSF